MKKAAEAIKQEQERSTMERDRIIQERCGDPEDLDWGMEGWFHRSNLTMILIQIPTSLAERILQRVWQTTSVVRVVCYVTIYLYKLKCIMKLCFPSIEYKKR